MIKLVEPPAPVPEPGRPSGHRTRAGITLVVVALLAAVAIVATQPEPTPTRTTSTVEEGGLEWGDVEVIVDDADGATVQAAVLLDDEAFPEATARDDRFVMFQLGEGGRFDVDEHVDDSAAEQLIGLGDDDTVQLFSTPEAGAASLPAGTGKYAMSLDGTITYRAIPPGTYELRAVVVDRTGAWGGQVAERTVRVE